MNDNPKFKDLLKQLAEIQAANAKVNWQIFVKEGKEQVQEKVQSAKDEILEQAKIYGQKIEKIEQQYSINKEEEGSIIEQYRKVLSDINKEYGEQLKNIIAEKQEWQTEEQEAMVNQKKLQNERKEKEKSPEYKQYKEEEKKLIKEAKAALEGKDPEIISKKTEELKNLRARNPLNKYDKKIDNIIQDRKDIQQIIEECDKKIENCKENRAKDIEQVTRDKDNKLSVMKKQNIIQKMLGSIFNKVNGTKKFKDAVIGRISDKIEKIKNEDIPRIKTSVYNESVQFSERMQDIKEKMKGRTLDVKEKVVKNAKEAKEAINDKVINRGKNTIASIVEKARQAKANISDRLESSISNAIEKAQTKNQELTDKLNNSEGR